MKEKPYYRTLKSATDRLLQSLDDQGATDQATCYDALRKALSGPEAAPDPKPWEKPEVKAALTSARDHFETGDPKAAVQALAALKPPALLTSATQWQDSKPPDPVLWRDDDSTRWPQPVLSVGELCLLSGEGGLGKSYVTLALAHAAATADGDSGSACGLRVRPGPAVLVSYEDSPVRIADRLRWMAGGIPAGLHLWDDPSPLWAADPESRGESKPGAAWDRLWQEVRASSPSLVVVDPASAALADLDTSQTGPVRQFLRALSGEAAAARCGVLVVTHSTKAARNAARRGEDPGAGVVSGSAAWFDGARGVLSLWQDRLSNDRVMVCEKSNYGKKGWGVRLYERLDGQGHFQGLAAHESGPLERNGVREFWKSQKPSQANAKNGGQRAAKPNGRSQPGNPYE